MIRDIFNVDKNKFNLELITEISNHVNKKLDTDTSINEKEHNQISRIVAVAKALNVQPNNNQIKRFIITFNKYLVANDNCVILLDSFVFDYMRGLKDSGKIIILLSNSGFISGEQTRQILNRLNLFDIFNQIYLSDEIGYSKPSSKIYNYVIDDLKQKYNITSPNDVVHIGDNNNFDYLAARYNGLCAAHIDLKHDHIDRVPSIVEYKIDSYDNNIHCSNDKFTEYQYSRFKFGVKSEIYNAAILLSEKLIKQYGAILFDKKPPTFIKAYKNIMPASVLLVFEIKKIIDLHRLNLGLDPSNTLHLIRKNDSLDSYAYLHAHKRSEALFDDCYLEQNDLKKITPIFIIDDMYVSGAFSKKVKKTLVNDGFLNIFFFFIADCHNSALQANKSIEQEVNCASIQRLCDLEHDININNVIPTRKYYKLLLSSRFDDIKNHLSKLSNKFKRKVCLDLNTVSAEMPKSYRKNCRLTIKILEES